MLSSEVAHIILAKSAKQTELHAVTVGELEIHPQQRSSPIVAAHMGGLPPSAERGLAG